MILMLLALAQMFLLVDLSRIINTHTDMTHDVVVCVKKFLALSLYSLIKLI